MRFIPACLLALFLLAPTPAPSQEKPLPQEWDYAAAMKKVAAQFKGNTGVVLYVGELTLFLPECPSGLWRTRGR